MPADSNTGQRARVRRTGTPGGPAHARASGRFRRAAERTTMGSCRCETCRGETAGSPPLRPPSGPDVRPDRAGGGRGPAQRGPDGGRRPRRLRRRRLPARRQAPAAQGPRPAPGGGGHPAVPARPAADRRTAAPGPTGVRAVPPRVPRRPVVRPRGAHRPPGRGRAGATGTPAPRRHTQHRHVRTAAARPATTPDYPSAGPAAAAGGEPGDLRAERGRGDRGHGVRRRRRRPVRAAGHRGAGPARPVLHARQAATGRGGGPRVVRPLARPLPAHGRHVLLRGASSAYQANMWLAPWPSSTGGR